MTLHALAIPDDPADLARWLEGQLVSLDFGRFLAELTAFFPSSGPQPPRDVFDRWLPVALADGLDPVPADVLGQLLRHPAALAEFQERIVTDGGAYWDDVTERSEDLSRPFADGKRALDRILAAEPAAGPSAVAKRTAGRGYKAWALTATAVAACLAVAVGILAFGDPEPPPVMKSQIAWGWGKPSGLANEHTNPKDYLNKLAANAEEWEQYRPTDAEGVGTRIAELRIGCTRLMHSSYGSLGPADKAWLLDRCRAWAKAFDGHQQALDGGAEPLKVRADMDETVRSITTTLRDRAKQIG